MSRPAAVAAAERYDVDRLLAGYRTARAQEALFDVRDSPGIGYDEFVDADGNVRPAWNELADAVAERGRTGLDRLRSVVHSLIDHDGISYTGVDSGREDHGVHGLEPGPWRLDTLPLVVSAQDWEVLEAGLVQRSRLLDAVLADLYGPRRLLTEGLLPSELVFGHPGYVRGANGIEVPGHHQLFLHGCDISRIPDGSYQVNADWTQAPSGAGYALADRRVVAHAIPDLYENIAPRPTTPFAQALRLALIDAAPDVAQDPVVVVLSPGIYSETAFDQAYLATLLGFPLVESADLVVRDGKLWMRSLGTLKRVDVVLRRVDAAYADPLDLRADSRLGVVGLVEAQHRGAVTVVNTLGSGILESPGLMRFLPGLAERLLGEEPMLQSAPMYWGGIATERSHLLANLSSLLIKSTVGGKTRVGPTLSSAQLAELAARIEAMPWQWVGQELPAFSSAPTDHAGVLSSAGVGMRLFTVAQRSGYSPMIGGLGYVLAPGPAAYTLRSVAAKDIWVRPTERAIVETVAAPVTGPIVQPILEPSALVPIKTGAGTLGVSSPRVLSDLFWMGRYGERAENMARLLMVARERYHLFRHHQDTEESECVPVLMAALGNITGTDTGAANDHAEMIAVAPSMLWSMTVDLEWPGSLVQSVEGLALAARAVRDQLSNDTWIVLADVERAVTLRSDPPQSLAEADGLLAEAQAQTLAGMLTLSGVASESMVRDVGWTMMDIGKRIERGLWLTALLADTLTTVRGVVAEQTIIESTLEVCESSVIYRRRTVGQFSVTAVNELMLFDAHNPRSLIYQLERLRANLKDLPGTSGSSRPERMVDEISARLRRSHPAELEEITDGRRTELAELLNGIHVSLRELAEVITDTQLALPGGMQPLWGPEERRTMPA
ncbi:circularly permuted type 2 ATP-grasp protein [Mycobacterium marinum]|uniref:circularly permuted type 2 ATP-grasp protein n=1 Tax=Mycobacterium marinum TaxID=1781 RepID=UPI000B95E5B3|nr:circularly permuted type 2 ATP-grasp protein [Mycobacterium marinum]MDC8980581.1 circularly permuted type 2 ATP-grasp protein [Mycobacterium marinum]MDC8992638.1 circularly permuted type 2 ATP-grasp protein [Mycobacterium marinum]MDC8997994.1 circularly permuted type 2 ATP-grasp protein [Mycobacterium marinum]MDC9008734.1 circularly permuted type 2 ATP-grasp protein [Mycobacterium marinum]MDC9014532.1 circularly permuted type 2 ATP-grasp protein [Mycobacterium marinum]